MGTHPIFESDFDCLTDSEGLRITKMPLEENIYTASQINIPADLPDLLKQFTKAAIKTQPTDILQWSAAYFTSLANGDPLPVKRRLEAYVGNGLTVGNLEVLVQQHKELADKTVAKSSIQSKWADLGLPKDQLKEILTSGNFGESFNFDYFTDDPAGYAERVEFKRFSDIYVFLANLQGTPNAQVELALNYLQAESEKQGGKIMPRNMATSECPSLG